MNENMEFPGATGDYIEWLQDSFVQTIQAEVSESAKDPFVKKEERGKVLQSLFKFLDQIRHQTKPKPMEKIKLISLQKKIKFHRGPMARKL